MAYRRIRPVQSGLAPSGAGCPSFRGDAFSKQSPGIELLPSSVTLRQRLDPRVGDLFDFVLALIECLLSSARPDYGVLPLDIDIFAMDSSTPTTLCAAWLR